MSRDAWLEWRRGGLGGSDIGAIFGLSPWRGPWDVYLSKMHGHDGTGNASTDTGNRLEGVVAEYAAERLGGEVELAPKFGEPGSNAFFRVGSDYWHRASADAVLSLSSSLGAYRAGLECKTAAWPNPDFWGEDGSAKIPASYDLQCRWYMAAFEAPDWFVSVFFKRADQWRIYKLTRDTEREREILGFAGDWWQRHIVEDKQPEIDDSRAAARALGYRFPSSDDVLDVATETEEATIREYHATKDAAADLERHAAKLANQIRQDIGTRAGLRFTGGRVKWSRKSNRLTVKIHD